MELPMRSSIKFDHLMRAFGRMWLAAFDLYALGVIAFLGLRLVSGFWLIELLNNFTYWVLLPAFFLMPWMVWRFYPIRIAMLTVPMLGYGLIFGGQYLPKSHDAPPDATQIRAMTFNVASYTSEVENIVQLIRDSEADVVALQEVSFEFGPRLTAELAQIYPYQSGFVVWGNRVPGKMLFSRYPILTSEEFSLGADRVYLRAEIEVEGQIVTVFNFHPPPPERNREQKSVGYAQSTPQEIQNLMALIPEDEPTLILCDCNLTDQNPNYDYFIAADLQDVYRESSWGLGATFPASGFAELDLPTALPSLIRIDYVWATDDFIPLNAEVLPDVGSDHLPLVVDLALR